MSSWRSKRVISFFHVQVFKYILLHMNREITSANNRVQLAPMGISSDSWTTWFFKNYIDVVHQKQINIFLEYCKPFDIHAELSEPNGYFGHGINSLAVHVSLMYIYNFIYKNPKAEVAHEYCKYLLHKYAIIPNTRWRFWCFTHCLDTRIIFNYINKDKNIFNIRLM